MSDSPVDPHLIPADKNVIAPIEPYNIPTQEKIDRIYAFVEKVEPVLDQVIQELPGFLESLQGNPMLKMFGFGGKR